MEHSSKSHPPSESDRYDTRLDIRFRPLEVVDVQPVVDSVTHPWFNQTLCKVNDSVVRLGVVKGEYHWHKHDTEDEFFYVVEGCLLIDLDDEQGRRVELHPKQGLVVPKGSCTARARWNERSC